MNRRRCLICDAQQDDDVCLRCARKVGWDGARRISQRHIRRAIRTLARVGLIGS